MDFTQLLGSVSGGVLGFGGAIISQVVGWWTKKKDHEMKMAEMKFEADLQAQNKDLDLRNLREKSDGESFVAAVAAQAALSGSTGWVKDVLALFRPGLTLALLIQSQLIAQKCSEDTRDFIALSIINLAATAGGYWFGTRTFEKVPVRYANKR
jgi:hypothetical protein